MHVAVKICGASHQVKLRARQLSLAALILRPADCAVVASSYNALLRRRENRDDFVRRCLIGLKRYLSSACNNLYASHLAVMQFLVCSLAAYRLNEFI